MIFTHSTRLGDSWTPAPEMIVKPALDVDAGEIRIEVDSQATCNKRPRTKNPRRWLGSLSTLRMHDKFVFDARFENTHNMAHQMMDVIAPVVLARKTLSTMLGEDAQIHVILRPEAPSRIRQSFRILGIPVVPTHARIEARFVRISCPFTATRCDGKILHKTSIPVIGLFPEIFRETSLGDPIPNLPEKVFIARKNSRFLLNESEISQLLEDHGFRKYYFEDIPVSEQWQVMANARQIVSIHGAAMASLVFNKHGQTVQPGDVHGLQIIELFGAGYQADLFRRYAAVLNAHWCAARGKITPKIVYDLDTRGLPRSHEGSPFLLDVKSLEMALKYSQEHAHRRPQTV